MINLKTKTEQGHSEEDKLIERARGGDHVAFGLLVSPLEKKMLNVAISLCNDDDEADDVYQEAMINAYKALDSFRYQSQFSTWLYRIVVNTAMTQKRRVKRQLNKILHIQQENEAFETKFQSTQQAPEAAIYKRQLTDAINNSLRKLAAKERIAFTLCHLQELKIAEAATIMECSDGAVKSFVFRAREKMRNQLQAFYKV